MSDYSEEYIESVFYLWVQGGKKLGNPFLNSLPELPDKKTVSRATLNHWIESRGWKERADAIEAEASRAMDELFIDRRKKMYEEQAHVADELIKKGMEFLNASGKGIQTDSSAIRAIDLGLATQRSSIGMAEAYVKISKMSDDQIDREISRLLGKSPDDAVDAEILEDD